MPLRYLWHRHGKPIGRQGYVNLDGGDLYIMSEKAVGFDTYEQLTLRHAAGKDGTDYARVKSGPQPEIVPLVASM